jgi:PhzF family phenazine biosynthesis protein
MNIPIYQIDAFTTQLFRGNPAAICHLPYWLSDEVLQNIAIENNLAETGFFVEQDGKYEIRWFMPHAEIDLCGHATLASAYVIFNYLHNELQEVAFSSKSGMLYAKKESSGAITLDFPSRPPKEIAIPTQVFEAFKTKPLSAHAARDLILVFPKEEDILKEEPNLEILKELPYLCTVITSIGNEMDFVSRVFDPAADMPEDPVTGSAHTSLAPYWAVILNKKELKAAQLSKRRGEIICKVVDDRVFMTGFAVPYLVGNIVVDV